MLLHPFVILTGVDADGKPVATHIPVLFEERDDKLYLIGHVMKHTDHHKAFLQNPNVLVVFNGPHAYVSASWYEDKLQASTWNYMTVHVTGRLHFLPDEALPGVLSLTTAFFENDENSPSLVKHLPDGYMNRLMKAIIAFKIEVTDLDHVFKLSQNRDEQSYKNIVEKLNSGDGNAQAIAAYMTLH